MIKLSCFCLVFLAVFVNQIYADEVECTEPLKACISSAGVAALYDCNSMCCGGEVVAKSAGSCCGNADKGQVYDPAAEICCVFNGQVAVHVRDEDEGGYCCGVELITNSMSTSTACCGGWKSAEPFNYFTEMCCGGKRNPVADTAFGACCGDVAFDRRNQSCPCGSPPVADSAYTSCCNGVSFGLGYEFCCNGAVGSSFDSVCCGGAIVATSAGSATGCCELVSGESVQYDTGAQVCCGGVLSDVAEGTVCCGGAVVAGDGCCDGVAYDTAGAVCCNGLVQEGDGCCGNFSYNSLLQTCCGDSIYDLTSNVNNPSCCAGVLFDAAVSTCCGATVHDNPVVNGAVSGTTRCCGNVFAPETLVPYDYVTQACCAGVITAADVECVVEEEGSA